jgi:polar amino acid transport system substrate-binding protein
MKRNTLKILLVLALMIALPFSGMAQKSLAKILNSGEIRIGMSGTQPPFTMYSKSDSLMGYEVELAEMIAEAMGVKLVLVEIPFADLLQSLEDGKVDAIMSGVTITPKRNLKAMFVGPYIISGKSILTRSQKLAGITDLYELNNPSITLAALKGSTSEEFVRKWVPLAKLEVTKTHDEAVKLVINNKVDALFADYPVCVYAMYRYPLIDLAILDEPLTIEPIGMAISPSGFLLHNLLQNYLNSLQMLGVLDSLEYKWFESGEWLDKVKQ